MYLPALLLLAISGIALGVNVTVKFFDQIDYSAHGGRSLERVVDTGQCCNCAPLHCPRHCSLMITPTTDNLTGDWNDAVGSIQLDEGVVCSLFQYAAPQLS